MCFTEACRDPDLFHLGLCRPPASAFCSLAGKQRERAWGSEMGVPGAEAQKRSSRRALPFPRIQGPRLATGLINLQGRWNAG